LTEIGCHFSKSLQYRAFSSYDLRLEFLLSQTLSYCQSEELFSQALVGWLIDGPLHTAENKLVLNSPWL
jgi:hypothetical protein